MSQWKKVPIHNKIFQNVSETALSNANAALENAYVVDTGQKEYSIVDFPRLYDYVTLPGGADVFLYDWQGDLIAVSGGKSYRVDINSPSSASDGSDRLQDVTGVVLVGSGRPIFSKTDTELLYAAGGPILSLKSNMTQKLSESAPLSTHVGYTGGRVVAIEPKSGRFQHTAAGTYTEWDPLDTFSAEGKPDNIVALIVNEFSELLMAGTDSIEQFDQAPSGTQPFFRRWGIAAGLYEPALYTLISVDNRVWGVNGQLEFVNFSTQYSDTSSRDIQGKLEGIDDNGVRTPLDMTGGWTAEVSIGGQRFILLQFPVATNIYGSEGVTFLYNYITQRWSSLYGFDYTSGLPTKWPGVSYHELNGRQFVGGKGKIYELGRNANNLPQRILWRSGHFVRPNGGELRIDRMRLRLKRGENPLSLTNPLISMRVNKDNRGFRHWRHRSLGTADKRSNWLYFPAAGSAHSFQFEIAISDNVPVNIDDMQILITELG